ncbi:acyltransferase family protein [Blautia sp. HCP28S3_G10]|uniref:acyltransferase family protein n=1 Tax=Blautia sp. HCP28S3_G10 TaxID=3438908 RepID=UPI003F88AECA
MMERRNTTMDCVRGIGILSIVIGHCCYGLEIPLIHIKFGEFVYCYHLMIFFFVAGFFFKTENAVNSSTYIGSRLLKYVSMFWWYNLIFILLHNFFVTNGMISNIDRYRVSDIVSKSVQGLLMKTSEELLGACWFLPMFFIGISLFSFVCGLIEKYFLKGRLGWHLFSCGLFAIVALYCNVRNLTWDYQIQISLLAIPVMYAGYISKLYWNVLESKISWYGTLASFIFIVSVLKSNIGIIELSSNKIINPFLFYPVTFAGVYFCIGSAKILNKFNVTNAIFSKMGRDSFHIMALHFCGFKIIDYVYSKLHGISDVVSIGRFPHSDFGLHWIYVFGSIAFSLVVITILRKGRETLDGLKIY